MTSLALMHDTSWKAACEVVRRLAPQTDDTELRQAFEKVYEIIKKALMGHEVKAERMRRRVNAP